MRIICELIGCNLDSDTGHDCSRCGAQLYYDWLEYGRLEPLFRACHEVIALIRGLAHRCAHCGKWMILKRGACCSKNCFDDWLPF